MIRYFSKSRFYTRGLSFLVAVLSVLSVITMNLSVLKAYAEGPSPIMPKLNDQSQLKASAYLDGKKGLADITSFKVY